MLSQPEPTSSDCNQLHVNHLGNRAALTGELRACLREHRRAASEGRHSPRPHRRVRRTDAILRAPAGESLRLDEMEAVGFRFTEEEGADSHCEPAAKGIRGERIFDWLDQHIPA